MTRKIFSVLVLVAVALIVTASAPAAAQANTTNATDSVNSPNGPSISRDPGETPDRLYIDQNAYVSDWSYDDGTYQVTLEANESTTVFLFPPMQPGETDQGNYESRSVHISPDSPRQVSIQGGNQLVIITEDFFNSDGNPYVLLDGPDPLIGPPWTASDARLSAIGAFAAAVVVIGWKVFRQLTGIRREPERVA